MRTSPPLPAGLRVRHLRDGTPVYFASKDGRRHNLGNDLQLALVQWVRVQHGPIASPRDTTADLLAHACSAPSGPEAAARQAAELAVLATFFVESSSRWLAQLPALGVFISWYGQRKRLAPADASVRLLRRAWGVRQRLGTIGQECPWPSIDLRKPRLQLEAADVIHSFAQEPLKRLLDTLLHDTAHAAADQLPRALASNAEPLLDALKAAVPLAVQALSESGRTDLRPAVYQLKLDDLAKLAASPVLALARPNGRLRLERRAIMLSELKAARDARGRSDAGSTFALPDGRPILGEEAP